MEKKENSGIAKTASENFQSPPKERQLLDKKAEEYLSEGGNIEDMPNAREEEDAQKLLKALKEEEEEKKIDRRQEESKRNDN